MYRLAILSDVHSDLVGLERALIAIDALGVDQLVCAGDLVDMGPDPEAVLSLLEARAIPCVRGNHDRWALGRGRDDGLARDDRGNVLSREATLFLAGLPTRWSAHLEGLRVVMVHASPRSDMDQILPDVATTEDLSRWLEQAGADVLVVGHTHRPFRLAAPGGKLVVNPGSLLREDDEIPTSGTFGVLTLPAMTFEVISVRDS